MLRLGFGQSWSQNLNPGLATLWQYYHGSNVVVVQNKKRCYKLAFNQNTDPKDAVSYPFIAVAGQKSCKQVNT
jgi:hypothetical protein